MLKEDDIQDVKELWFQALIQKILFLVCHLLFRHNLSVKETYFQLGLAEVYHPLGQKDGKHFSKTGPQS